jgi:hypothetical protein
LKKRTNIPWTSLIVDLATVHRESLTASIRPRGGFRELEFRARRLSQSAHPYSKSLLPKNLGRRLREEESRRIYGVGEASAGDSVVVDVPVEDSVVEAGLVASVVVGGLVAAGLAAGSVVSVFCSHPARSAAPARMQMYFFIV